MTVSRKTKKLIDLRETPFIYDRTDALDYRSSFFHKYFENPSCFTTLEITDNIYKFEIIGHRLFNSKSEEMIEVSRHIEVLFDGKMKLIKSKSRSSYLSWRGKLNRKELKRLRRKENLK